MSTSEDQTQPTPAQAAAAAIAGAEARVRVTTGGGPGAKLPESKFPRLSLERRVLGHVSDEVDETEFGPRNTLAALTRALMTDRNTINVPTSDHGSLDVSGTVAETAQRVLDVLTALEGAGLVVQRGDDSYALTDDGVKELTDGNDRAAVPEEDEHGRRPGADGVWRSDGEAETLTLTSDDVGHVDLS
jgi:hypothetical protein